MTQAYPLHWPESFPRTKTRVSSQFKTTLTGALKNVQDEIRRFGNDSGKPIKDLVISSNYTLGDNNPSDPGVALYFTWDGIATCIAVDQYNKLACNLQAIHHVISAERTKMRHGGLNIVRAAFRGYASLPPPSASSDPWHVVLNVPEDALHQVVEKQYKNMRSKNHPDHGGDATQFDRIQKAWGAYCAQRTT